MTQKTKLKLEKLLESVGDMALKRRARRIIEELDPQPGENILDVGCGDGYYLYLLGSLGIPLRLVGVDFDPSALKSARKNLNGKKVKLSLGNLMDKLPFKSDSFDKAVMSEVVEHLPNDVKGLSETRRVLKKNGTLLLTGPNQNYPLFWDPINWILELFFNTHVKSGFWAGIWNQHKHLYKPEEIKKVVERAGFKVEIVESLTWWCLPFNHNLLHFMARRLYGGTLSVSIAKAVSKYEVKKKKPLLIETAFKIVNLVDRLNDLFQPKNRGVGIFVKALK